MQLKDPRRNMPKMYQRQVEFYKPFETEMHRRAKHFEMGHEQKPASANKKPKMLVFGVIIVVVSGILFWDLSGQSDPAKSDFKVLLTSGVLYQNALTECRIETKDDVFFDLEIGILSGNLNLDDLTGGNYRLKNVQFKGITKSSFFLSKNTSLTVKKIVELLEGIDQKSQFVFARVAKYKNLWDWLTADQAQYFVYAKGVNK